MTSLHNQNIVSSILEALYDIGYKKQLIKFDYYFTDFLASTPNEKKIDIAVFGQEPFDYRSSCFSFNFIEPTAHQGTVNSQIDNYRAFGAPYNFIINNGKTKRFLNLEDRRINKVEEIQTDNLVNYLKAYKNSFNPTEIIRAKSSLIRKFHDPDLFVDSGLLPALEHEVFERIDFLISSLINKIQDEISKYGYEVIFRIIFGLLTAKLLKDKNIETEYEINFDNPDLTLKAVKNYYGNIFNYNKISPEALSTISQQIKNSISFKNLSVDTLTYVYENTLVSPISRKKHGIHSTPSYLAEYIISKIPLDTYNNVNFYDPMCGHGIFLIAAMRKLRSLLPSDWSGKKRHNHYIKSLIGTEIDIFSIEVAKMCLTLADFPEADGWNITQADIFKGNLLENLTKETTCFVTNPPFEYEKIKGKQIPKPKYLLERVLMALPLNSFVGIILPKSFLDSNDYREERSSILSNFRIIDITNLPDNIFQHSQPEVCSLIFEKTKKNNSYTFSYNTVNKKDSNQFKSYLKISWAEEAKREDISDIFVIPYLLELWKSLESFPKLHNIADIKLGVQNEPSKVTPKSDYKEKYFKGSVPAIVNAKDNLTQYVFKKTHYIPSDKSLRRKRAMGAWNLNWESPKIILPSGRISIGPWKFAAILDYDKRYATRNFYAVWPKANKIDIRVITAILNAPLANAYIFSFSSGRSIYKRYYESIPIPPLETIKKNSDLIASLVEEYIYKIEEEDYSNACNILIKIDAEVLKLYNLSPKMEKMLLDIFEEIERPIHSEFKRYYPPNFKSYIPLHIYISEQYKNSTFEKFVKDFPEITNRESIDFIKELN